MNKKHKIKWLICLGGLLVLTAEVLASPVGVGDVASESAAHLVPGPPGGSCCDGDGTWVKSGDPTYSWSGDALGSDDTAEWDTSLGNPEIKEIKYANVTVTQNWVCSIAADPSTQQTTESDSFSIEVWPKCGSTPYDSDDYCCDGNDSTLISKNELEPQPAINAPSGGNNLTNQNIPVPTARWSIQELVGISQVNPWGGDCTDEILIYERHFINPTNNSINDILTSNRYETTNVTGTAGSCGLELNINVQTGGSENFSLTASTIVKGVNLSANYTYEITPGTSSICNEGAQGNRWLYYEIFKHEVRLSGGTHVLNYDIDVTQNDYRGCDSATGWFDVGGATTGLVASSDANLNTQWKASGAQYCATASNRCCSSN